MKVLPRISAVICAFNAETTIAEAIQSVLRQSVRDLEVVVIDDGSIDGTADVVARCGLLDERVQLIIQSNGGIANARNRGVREARGEYIAFLDADDFWDENHLAIHTEMLSDDPDLAVAFGNVRHVDVLGRETGDRSRTPKGEVSARAAFSGNPCTTCSTMIIRRSVFDTAGPFGTGLDHAEDQEWILRLLLRGFHMACSSETSTAYRASPSGQSSDLAKMFHGFLSVREMAFREAPDFASRYAGEAEGRICLYLARRAIRLGQGTKAAAPHLCRALTHFPSLDTRAPAQLAAAIIAVAAPSLERRLSRFRGFRLRFS